MCPNEKALMTLPCIHGFREQECAACQTCPHGLATSRCGRCAATTTAAARRSVPRIEPPPSEEYSGFEIYYDPDVSGWHFRSPDAVESPLSYRSAFLARKAVDELGDAPVPARTRAKRSS